MRIQEGLTIGISIVGMSDTAETFLSSRVPDLQIRQKHSPNKFFYFCNKSDDPLELNKKTSIRLNQMNLEKPINSNQLS